MTAHTEVTLTAPLHYRVNRAKCDCCDDVSVFLDFKDDTDGTYLRVVLPDTDAEGFLAKLMASVTCPPDAMSDGELSLDDDWVEVSAL